MYTYLLGTTSLQSGSAEKARESWWPPSVSQQCTSRLIVFLAALAEHCQQVKRGDSSPKCWWNHTYSSCPVLVQESHGLAGISPEESHQGDEETKAPLLWGEAGRAGAFQPGRVSGPINTQREICKGDGDRTSGSEHKLENRRLFLSTRKHFCAVRTMEN